MDKTEKNMLMGALATGAVDLSLEGYYVYENALGTPPANQFPYITIHPALPPLDDWIALAGFPLGLYALGKLMKKPSIVTMSKGGMIYGVSELVGLTAYRLALQAKGVTTQYVLVR